ncbi:hypothetical protein GCM10023235_55920 [Kitasatospora terrestris]|uniref:Uncharacterized protein n=1 Tax=Kitasatospora terrestris TaxID=258051 RepID=A0ABP9E833_9ACTN
MTSYANRASVPREMWLSLLQEAETQIDVLVLSGTFFAQTNPHVAGMLAERAAAGVRVRLRFGDPMGRAAAVRGREEGIGDSRAAKIRASLTYYRSLSAEVGCEVRLHDTTLHNSLFRYDGELLVNPHVWGQPASANPLLHLKRINSTDWFDNYARSFEAVWVNARPWTPNLRGTARTGRTEYLNDPDAPKADTLVFASNLLVVDDDSAILLQRRRDTGLEETGVVAVVTGFLGVYTNPNHIVAYTDGEIRQQYENAYIGRPVGGEPTINDEADGVRWVLSVDLDQYDIHPGMRQQIGDYLAGTYPYLG